MVPVAPSRMVWRVLRCPSKRGISNMCCSRAFSACWIGEVSTQYLILIKYIYFFLVVLQLQPPAGTWQTTKKKKKREGSSRGESKRKLLKETQNQGKETRKKKRIQEEYWVEGAQDGRRRRKPGGWKETPNTRKRGGDAQSCSCWDKSGKHRSTAKRSLHGRRTLLTGGY